MNIVNLFASAIPPERAKAGDRRFIRVDHLIDSAPNTFGGSLLAAMLLVAVLWGQIRPLWLGCWLAAMVVTTVLRAWRLRSWYLSTRDAEAYERGHIQFVVGTTLAGFMWTLCWLFVPSLNSPVHRYFLMVILCGVTAGTIPSLGAMMSAARIFLSLVILPGAFIFAVVENQLAWQFTLAAIIYLWVILQLAGRVNNTFENAIRQQIENEQLIDELSSAKSAAERLNTALAGKIEQQQAVERALIRARDQAELASKAKSEFLANMSHEIRTPMNGVLGMTELLLGTELTKNQRRFTTTIRNSGQALLGVINDILDFSKIEAGKLQLNIAPFDLRTLLEDVAGMFAERAERSGVAFACTYPADAHSMFQGDSARLQQILTNLIGNSLKFTREGEVMVRVTLRDTDNLDAQAKAQIKFEVVDTGIGIPDTHLDKIFDSFSQADNSVTRRFGGTGLGLAICKQLVTLMGGRIGVESTPGRGSTFWFVCSFQKAVAPKSEQTSPSLFRRRRIVVADGNASTSAALVAQLAAWDIEARVANRDEEVINLLAEAQHANRPIDCVIIDHAFAEGALRFVARYRKANPNNAQQKFVMLTTLSALESTGQWIDAGFAAYVQKPIRQQDLSEALMMALNISANPSSARTTTISPHSVKFDANILVAEDNAVNQELIRGILESLGCRMKVVDNGRELLRALLDRKFDTRGEQYQLVLMDCQMPELDGFSTTRSIREHEARHGTPPLPIIAITANALSGDREACLAAGMNDYLAKPFTRAGLVEKLQKWLPMDPALSLPDAVSTAPEPNSSPSGEASVLDPTALRNIRELQRAPGTDLLRKIALVYRQDAPRMLGEMRIALDSHDASRLALSAHTLKSSSASLGATRCAELCRELETLSRANNLPAIGDKLDVLDVELQRVYQALEAVSVGAAA